MKKVLFLVAAIALVSCSAPNTDEEGFSKTHWDTQKASGSDGEANYHVERLGKCQYLIGYRKGMHKGDCDNPIHCHNQNLEK